MVTPKRFSNSLCTSTGSAEPPAAATRRLAAISSTSTPESSRAPSRPQYIVGTPAKKVTLLLGHRLQRGVGLEARQHHDGAAVGEAAVHDHGLAEGVEQRQHAQVGVGSVGVGAEEVLAGERVGAHVAVAQLGALGLAGGAGRVEDDGGVVVVDLDRVERRRLPGHALAERLGALDRRRGGRVDGDHEEVLAAVGLLEAGVALLRRSAARRCPGSRSRPSPRSRPRW